MDLLPEFVLLAFDSLILAVCLKTYYRNANAYKLITEAPVCENDASLSQLIRSDQSKFPYVVLRGTVDSIGTPILSTNNPLLTGVIQKLSVKEHVITRNASGFWVDHQRRIQDVCNYVPFIIRTGKLGVEILDPLKADVLEMQTISDTFEPSKPSIADSIWGFLVGARQCGIGRSEEMLKVGSVVTALGELTKSEDGKVHLQVPSDNSPYVISSTPVLSLVRQLDQDKKYFRNMSLAFAGVGILLIGCLVRRWWVARAQKLRSEEDRKKRDETRKARRQLTRDSNLSEDHLCVVCKENPRELIVLPCGHVCLCEDCGDNISDFCPLCRTDITSKSPAYL